MFLLLALQQSRILSEEAAIHHCSFQDCILTARHYKRAKCIIAHTHRNKKKKERQGLSLSSLHFRTWQSLQECNSTNWPRNRAVIWQHAAIRALLPQLRWSTRLHQTKHLKLWLDHLRRKHLQTPLLAGTVQQTPCFHGEKQAVCPFGVETKRTF